MSSDGLSADRTRRMRADQIGEAFEREKFAVERDEHGVGGNERIQRQQSERRRAVDEDVVELDRARRRGTCEGVLRVEEGDELDLGAGQDAGSRG